MSWRNTSCAQSRRVGLEYRTPISLGAINLSVPGAEKVCLSGAAIMPALQWPNLSRSYTGQEVAVVERDVGGAQEIARFDHQGHRL